MLESTNGTGTFGRSVSSAGDVNGDGYDDVIVGGPFYSAPGALWGGIVYVFLGSASGLGYFARPIHGNAQFDSNQAYTLLGWSVAAAGDVNGDGFDDVIVGAPGFWFLGPPLESSAFMYLGSVTGLADPPPPPVPGLGTGGLVVVSVLLSALGVHSYRKRRRW